MTEDDIFAVTQEEGGRWWPPERWRTRAQAILFKDGTTWDEINGFRGRLFDYSQNSLALLKSNWE